MPECIAAMCSGLITRQTGIKQTKNYWQTHWENGWLSSEYWNFLNHPFKNYCKIITLLQFIYISLNANEGSMDGLNGEKACCPNEVYQAVDISIEPIYKANQADDSGGQARCGARAKSQER